MNPSDRLSGTVTLVTRSREQARDLQLLIESQGGKTLVQPGIEILPPADWTDFDVEARRLVEGAYDWGIFSSSNGARYAVERVRSLYPTEPIETLFSRVQLAAVGSGTRDALRELGLEVALMPDRFDAEGIVDAMAKRYDNSLARVNVLSFRANRGRKVLSEGLSALGAKVVELETYRSVDATRLDPAIETELAAGRIDFTTVASSATAKALVQLFGANASKTRWIAISPLTADALRGVGIEPASVATTSTMEGLVEAVVEARRDRDRA